LKCKPTSLLLALTLLFSVAIAYEISKMELAMSSKYGEVGMKNLSDWKVLMENIKAADEGDKVKRVNDFVNRKVTWGDDKIIWKEKDYWATPVETIGRSAGDCEDFSIAKYYSLLASNVPMKKLRLVYVKAQMSDRQQAHMVLAYYPEPNAEPLILDNIITSMRPAGRRPDLTPVFSFNGEGVFKGTANESQGGTERLSKWQDLMKRAQIEGSN